MRKIFYIIYYLLAKNLPNMLKGNYFRQLIARKLFAKCGKNIIIRKGAVFGSGDNIVLGNNSRIGAHSIIMVREQLIIGDNVEMGPDVIILDYNHAFGSRDIPIINQGYSPAKQIVINDNVWIGARTIILPGVHIEKGAIIGAGSVVTKNIPEFSIAAGNPAKVLRYR